MSSVADTSFVVALLNPRDRHHDAVARVAIELREQPWLPTPALTEIAYVLQARSGPDLVRRFLERLNHSAAGLALLDPLAQDYSRCEQILRQYGDGGLDFVDAITLAVAERLNVDSILTLDRRHFGPARQGLGLRARLLPDGVG